MPRRRRSCKDAVYVSRLLMELRPNKVGKTVQCYLDNQAAIDIIKRPLAAPWAYSRTLSMRRRPL